MDGVNSGTRKKHVFGHGSCTRFWSGLVLVDQINDARVNQHYESV
jgi:hypothetical protein